MLPADSGDVEGDLPNEMPTDTGAPPSDGGSPGPTCWEQFDQCEAMLLAGEIGVDCSCSQLDACGTQACFETCKTDDMQAFLDCVGDDCADLVDVGDAERRLRCAQEAATCYGMLEPGLCDLWCGLEEAECRGDVLCNGQAVPMPVDANCEVVFPTPPPLLVQTYFDVRTQSDWLAEAYPGDPCPPDGLGIRWFDDYAGFEVCPASCASLGEPKTVTVEYGGVPCE